MQAEPGSHDTAPKGCQGTQEAAKAKEQHRGVEALDALVSTLYEEGEGETPQSAAKQKEIDEHNRKCAKRQRRERLPGFAEGSERHRRAVLAGVPLVEYEVPKGQDDLFAAPAGPKRLDVEECAIYTIAPYAYGGPPPEGSEEEIDEIIDWHTPIAWDAQRVMIMCPRGLCLLKRKRWEEGWRSCRGC